VLAADDIWLEKGGNVLLFGSPGVLTPSTHSKTVGRT